MFERGKLATSLLRAASIVAVPVMLTAFCTFADSLPAAALKDQIELSANANPLTFVEGGKAQNFILTVKNVSDPAQKIGIKSINITEILTDGTDRSDTILPLPKPTTNCPANAANGIAAGKKCTFTYAVTPCPDPVMFGSCAEKKENLDSGETTVRFSVAATLGPTVNYDEVFIVNDKGFPAVPEPATLPLTTTGVLSLAALVRLRRDNRQSA
jgi:hypothetical protein